MRMTVVTDDHEKMAVTTDDEDCDCGRKTVSLVPMSPCP
jgi:hypothetical protein